MIPTSEDARYLRITRDTAHLRHDLNALKARVDQIEETAREAVQALQAQICELEALLKPHLNGGDNPHE